MAKSSSHASRWLDATSDEDWEESQDMQEPTEPPTTKQKTDKAAKEQQLEKNIDGCAEEEGGAKHECTHCRRYFFANKILIWFRDPSYEWQGRLPNMYCFQCSAPFMEFPTGLRRLQQLKKFHTERFNL